MTASTTNGTILPKLHTYLHTNFSIGWDFHFSSENEKCDESEANRVNALKIVCAGRGDCLTLPAIYNKVISLTSKACSPSDVNVVYICMTSYDRQDRYEAQTQGF